MIRFSFAASVFHFDDPLIQDYLTKNRSYNEFKYLPKLSPLCRLTVSDSSRLACFLVIQISGWSIKHVYELQWIPCRHVSASTVTHPGIVTWGCCILSALYPPGKVDKITLDKITVLKNITVQSQTGTWTTQIWKKRKKALPYLLQSLGSASLPLSHREAALLLAVAHVWSTGACPNVVPTSLNSFTGAPWTPSRRPIAPLSWQPHTRECRASLWA